MASGIQSPDFLRDQSIRDMLIYYHERKPRRRRMRSSVADGFPSRRAVYRLRCVEDYCHDDQWIVWRPGCDGECELVNAERCTCESFAATGHCEHFALVHGQLEGTVAA